MCIIFFIIYVCIVQYHIRNDLPLACGASRLTWNEGQTTVFQQTANEIVIYNHLGFATSGNVAIFAPKTGRETAGDRLT